MGSLPHIPLNFTNDFWYGICRELNLVAQIKSQDRLQQAQATYLKEIVVVETAAEKALHDAHY